MKVCCLIPAYNEERTIGAVIRGCRPHLADIVVVDDGSTDGTPEAARGAGAHLLRHEKNSGKGMALKTGFSFALKEGFDAVLSIDADGQHDPEEIPKFLDAYKAGGGIIIGARLWDRKEIPLQRYISNMVGVFFISLAAGQKIPDTQSGFRIYGKEVLEDIEFGSKGFEAETEILIKAGRAGFSIGAIPVRAIYPENHNSHFRAVRDFTRISLTVLKTIYGGVR